MGDNARSFPRLLLVGAMSLLAAFTLLVATPAFDANAQAKADSWLWPVPDWTSLSRGYSSSHDGQDILAYQGAPILASKSGTVYKVLVNGTSYSNWGGYGNGVVIKHSDGYYTHYAHMNSVSVKEGQSVTQGTQIGTMGATGNATGVHLHFAIATSPYGAGGRINNNRGVISYISDVTWWKGETVQNLGSDFYANMLLSSTWINATVNPGESYRIMNADRSLGSDTRNYQGIFWHFVRNSDGSYRMLSCLYNERPLQASDTTSGSNLVLGSSYTGANTQKWFIYRANGKRIIRNAACDFVINVDSASSSPGARWQLWKYTDTAAERINIYTHTPAQATTLGVKAGTASAATTFTWAKPSTGETAYYNLRITALDSNGTATSTKYDEEKIDAADTSKTVQLPEGKYRATIETCSWFNTASSSAVTFEVKNADTEAPTISEAKVTSVSNSAVTIVVKATDNVGIAETVSLGGGATTDGVSYSDYVEVGVPGSGKLVAGSMMQTIKKNGLDSTSKKDVTITLTITSGLISGHHVGRVFVKDVNGNESRADVSFDKPYKSTVYLELGESISAAEAFGLDSTTGWRASDGDQDVIGIVMDGDITAKNLGTCIVVAYNTSGQLAYRKFTVIPAGQEAPTVSVADQTAADNVAAAIWALPEAEDVTLDDAAAIEAAAQELDNLSETQVELIVPTTMDQLTAKLGAAQDALTAAQQEADDAAKREAEAQADQQAAQAALAAVNGLKDVSSLTLDDAQAVYDAQDALSDLAPAQRDCISEEDWVAANEKVQAAIEKLEKLEKNAVAEAADQVAASEAANAVADLPAADELTVDDEAAVNAAKAALDALSPEQKAKLSNYNDLKAKVDAAAAKIEELKAGQGGDDPAKATDISKATVKLESTSMPYHMGRAIKPKVTIDGLKEGVDFTVYYSNNREVGDSAQVEVVGTGNCTGRQTLTFSIVRADIAKEFPDLAVDKASYAYTGKAIKPGVKSDTWDLESDYYTLSYANNTEIGTATVTVKGKGGYTGSKKLTFAINPPKVTLSKAKAGKKKISVKAKAAKGGVKYQVSYRVAGGKWVNKTSKKATYTAKKLKSGKKYQVKVRAMKTVGGKTYYGAWSKTKTVKVK